MWRIALAGTIVAVSTACGGHGHTLATRASPRPASVATTPRPLLPTLPTTRLFAASNQGQCVTGHSVNAFLRAHRANVLRVILSPYRAENGASLICIEAAYAARYKVYLSLQFSNRWTPRQDAAYFARVVPRFAPCLWAIGVGNEQDLPDTVLPGQRPKGLSGKGYRLVWDAVEAGPSAARSACASRLR